MSTYAILKAVGDGTFFVRLVGTRALIFEVACRRELKTLEHIAEVPTGTKVGERLPPEAMRITTNLGVLLSPTTDPPREL